MRHNTRVNHKSPITHFRTKRNQSKRRKTWNVKIGKPISWRTKFTLKKKTNERNFSSGPDYKFLLHANTWFHFECNTIAKFVNTNWRMYVFFSFNFIFFLFIFVYFSFCWLLSGWAREKFSQNNTKNNSRQSQRQTAFSKTTTMMIIMLRETNECNDKLCSTKKSLLIFNCNARRRSRWLWRWRIFYSKLLVAVSTTKW